MVIWSVTSLWTESVIRGPRCEILSADRRSQANRYTKQSW